MHILHSTPNSTVTLQDKGLTIEYKVQSQSQRTYMRVRTNVN